MSPSVCLQRGPLGEMPRQRVRRSMTIARHCAPQDARRPEGRGCRCCHRHQASYAGVTYPSKCRMEVDSALREMRVAKDQEMGDVGSHSQNAPNLVEIFQRLAKYLHPTSRSPHTPPPSNKDSGLLPVWSSTYGTASIPLPWSTTGDVRACTTLRLEDKRKAATREWQVEVDVEGEGNLEGGRWGGGTRPSA